MIKNKNLGFTLIELLVVVAIISLLSSIVLAVVNDAREKAKAKAFRQEIMQFINAVELYKNVNNSYPFSSSENFYYNNQYNGSVTAVWLDGNLDDVEVFKTMMSPYIEKLPEIPTPSQEWYFIVNPTASQTLWKCEDDEVDPQYIILVTNGQKGFEDWPAVVNSTTEAPEALKCFSLK